MPMNLDDLDALLAQSPNGDKHPQHAKAAEHWISWPEWQWRQGDRILDESRKKQRLRPVGKDRREKVFKEFYESYTSRANQGI